MKKILFIIILFFFITLGSYWRYVNLFNIGYHFDTVYTQYNWGKYAYDYGIVEFYRSYPFFDYFPASLYYQRFIYSISFLFFDGQPQSFVTIMKVFNWFFDFLFVFLIFLLSKHIIKNSTLTSLFFASFMYFLPSLWIVSGVWGHLDTLIGALMLLTILLLFWYVKYMDAQIIINKNDKLHKFILKNLDIIAGLVFGLTLMLKMTGLLILPIILLLFFKLKRMNIARFLIPMLFIILIFSVEPSIGDLGRHLYSLGQPFVRTPELIKGAASIWELLNVNKSMEMTFFKYGNFSIHLSLIIYPAFTFIMTYVFFLTFGFPPSEKINKIFSKKFISGFVDLIKYHIEQIKNKKYSELTEILFLTSILGYSYYMLFPSVHSRYLHSTLVVLLILLPVIYKFYRHKFKYYFFIVSLVSIAYFLNQLVVLANPDIVWTKNYKDYFIFDFQKTASLLNIITISLIIVFYRNNISSCKNTCGIKN